MLILRNKKTLGPYFDLIFYSFCVFCSSSLLSHGHGTENARFRSMDRMRSYSSHCSVYLGELNRINKELLMLVNMETQYFIFSSGKVNWNSGNMFPISQVAKKKKLIFGGSFLSKIIFRVSFVLMFKNLKKRRCRYNISNLCCH